MTNHASRALAALFGGLSRGCGALATKLGGATMALTESQLRDQLDLAAESPTWEKDERDLIKSVFELGDTLAREVMVPRTDMVTVGADEPLRRVMKLFLRSGYSRIPVVGDSVDEVVGVAYFKDIARLIAENPIAADRQVRAVVRTPVFIPESKPIDELLREMQAAASHITLVVDEYGGIAGLLTIEDILEELVGELTDEHDRARNDEPADLGNGKWRVSARMPVDQLGDLFHIELDHDDVDTVGGLLAKALGSVPLAGSAADVDGLHLVAERTEGRRKQVVTVIATMPANSPSDPREADDASGHASGNGNGHAGSNGSQGSSNGGSNGGHASSSGSQGSNSHASGSPASGSGAHEAKYTDD